MAPGIDALSTQIGPYSTNGFSLPMNDLSLLPIIQQYQNSVGQLDAASTLNSPVIPGQMPTAPTFNTEDYYRQAEEIQNRNMENQLRQTTRYNQMNSEINGPMYKITEAADILHDKVLQNEQDQIKEALHAYINAYKEMYYKDREDIDEATLLAEVKTHYRNRFGSRLEDDLRNNSTSEFMNGFLQNVSFGLLGDKVTAEENIADINHQPVSATSKKWKKTGKIVGSFAGAPAVGAAAGAIIGTFIAPGAGTVLGAKIGAWIGGALGTFSFFSKK